MYPALVVKAVLLSHFLPPQTMSSMGPEQLGSLLSAGAVFSLCLLQGGGLVVEMRCRALHSPGYGGLYFGRAEIFGSAWEGG